MKFTEARTKLLQNWLLQKIPWTEYWEVMQEFIWYLDYELKDEKIIVPKWFITDFGSIPLPLRLIFNPTKYVAYILHDYLYSEEWDIVTLYWNKEYDRMDADNILADALQVEWMWTIWTATIFTWVWIGGKLAYKH